MLWIPFILDYFIERLQQVRYRIYLSSALMLVFISSLGGIFNFGYSKAYLYNAGNWLATHVPSQVELYTNDYQLMYYSQYFGHTLFTKFLDYSDVNQLNNNGWKKFDYLAIRVNKKEATKVTQVLQQIPLMPIQVFKNERGDAVLIYKIKT